MKKQTTTSHDLFTSIFDGHHVGFELVNGDIMVNATEMAKAFDKLVGHFLENESTNRFIEACLNNRNSDYLKVKSKEDLIISKQKSGTWMHRVLALKFAAWLDADFEVWVYTRIDEILFGHFRRIEESLKDSARRQSRLDTLAAELGRLDTFLEYMQLESEERRAASARAKYAAQQRDTYKGSLDTTTINNNTPQQ
jgi:hypothetical protein